MQRLTLDFAGRSEKQIAKAWVDKLVTSVRKQDPRHLITIGEIPWALNFPGAKPLFQSKDVGRNLDFVSLHFYPRTGQLKQALKALRVYNVGKPIIIEEMTWLVSCWLGGIGPTRSMKTIHSKVFCSLLLIALLVSSNGCTTTVHHVIKTPVKILTSPL